MMKKNEMPCWLTMVLSLGLFLLFLIGCGSEKPDAPHLKASEGKTETASLSEAETDVNFDRNSERNSDQETDSSGNEKTSAASQAKTGNPSITGAFPEKAAAKDSATPAISASEAKSDSASERSTLPGSGFLSPKETISVRMILDGMVSAYRNAKTYRDRGEIRVSWSQNGNSHERRVVYRTTFQRPNRLILEVNRTGVLADGKVLCAHTPEMPGMLLRKSCPSEIGFLDILCEREVYWSLTDVESNRFCYLPPPLVLLWGTDPLATFLYQTEQANISLLPSKEWEGHECCRISAKRNEEETVFWIDAQTFVLRRIELPRQILRKETASASDSPDEEMVVTLDFHDAELNWSGVLEMSTPANTVEVSSFSVPQIEALGKPFPEFQFTGLDGRKISRQTFQGKTIFLFFWSVYDLNSFNFHDMEQIYQKFRTDSRIGFLGVNLDPLTVSNEKIRSSAEKLGISIPLARDETGQVARMLRNGESFTCFLIDPHGTIQFCDTLGTFHPSPHYDQSILRVLDGQDVFPDRVRELKRAEQDFQESIRLWVENGIFLKEADAEQIQIRGKKIQPASEPVVCKKTEIWRLSDVHSPSCLLPIPEKNQLLVLENGNCVTEVEASGKVLRRIPLEVKDDFFQKILRFTSPQKGKDRTDEIPAASDASTANDSRLVSGSASNAVSQTDDLASNTKNSPSNTGESAAFFAVTGNRAHVFDGNWKALCVYPNPDSPTAPGSISDVLFDDLDSDGKPELYVTFWNESSIRKVGLDGQEIAKGTGVLNVFQMAAVHVNGTCQLWVVDQSGNISIFDPKTMKLQKVQEIPQRTLSGLAAADLEQNGTDSIAAIAIGVRVRFKALGLTADGNEIWNIDLPNYVYQRKIKKILPIQILAQGNLRSGWCLLGPDSSVYLVEPSGILIDQFHFGKIITGCSFAVLNERPMLLVASPDDVTALEIQRE